MSCGTRSRPASSPKSDEAALVTAEEIEKNVQKAISTAMSEISEVFNNKLTKLHDCAVALEEHMLQPNTSDTSQSLQEMEKKLKR